MGLLISGNLKQIMLLFVILQLLLFLFLYIGRNILFHMKITTAAIAERTTFCLCLSFGWRHMPEKATWHQTGTCSSQLLSEHGFDHPAASWEPNDFGTINFCCFLETPGSWSGVGALGWDSTNTFRLWNAFSACKHGKCMTLRRAEWWHCEGTGRLPGWGHGVKRMAGEGGPHISDHCGWGRVRWCWEIGRG